MNDPRNISVRCAKLETELAKALALTRTLQVASRCNSPEPMRRSAIALVAAINNATDLMVEITAVLKEALDERVTV